MSRISVRTATSRLMVGATLALLVSEPVFANNSPPTAPRIDCSNPANKKKPACKAHVGPLSNDEIYNSAYWLAHAGRYSEALSVLAPARDTSDTRLLTEIGFVTRKLGDVDGALPYYRRALAIDPDNTLTREYMGEAFVSKGDLASARAQLGEIEARCGTRCVNYAMLAGAISAAPAAPVRGG
jgi:tetratricopeptide (TPR) repeat protein